MILKFPNAVSAETLWVVMVLPGAELARTMLYASKNF